MATQYAVCELCGDEICDCALDLPRRSPIGTAYPQAAMAREVQRLRESKVPDQLSLLKARLLTDAKYAALAGELAEHDLLQIALTQLDEVRKTIKRARKARSGV